MHTYLLKEEENVKHMHVHFKEKDIEPISWGSQEHGGFFSFYNVIHLIVLGALLFFHIRQKSNALLMFPKN